MVYLIAGGGGAGADGAGAGGDGRAPPAAGAGGGRRRRAARKESRLRESRSLNRIAEVFTYLLLSLYPIRLFSKIVLIAAFIPHLNFPPC